MEKSLPRAEQNVLESLRHVQHEIENAVVKYNRDAESVKLMAVTKTVPPEFVNLVTANGVSLLGENKAQELLHKYDTYTKDNVDIHFIGHLQSNKVKQIIDKVDCIQSVDRVSLADEINSQAKKIDKVMKVLIEVNIGDEQSKSGVAPSDLLELIYNISAYSHIKVAGLMTIPPICDSELQNERYFYSMGQLIVDITAKKIDNVSMDILSMGMSGDYVPAIKHGANIIRVGTAIFGSRNYN